MTLSRSILDVLHFLLVFTIAFFNFVLGGHLLFGVDVEPWSTFQGATSLCFRAAFGDFEYRPMHETSPMLAMVWFWCFMLVMAICLFNLILAIVIGVFANVRVLYGDCLSIFGQLRNIRVRDVFWGVLRSVFFCNFRRKDASLYGEGDGDNFLTGWRLGVLEKKLWGALEENVRREEERKRAMQGVEVTLTKAQVKKLMPSTAFELRLANNAWRVQRDVVGHQPEAVSPEQVMGVTGLSVAQATMLLLRAREDFNRQADPEQIRLKLMRIATKKCNNQVAGLVRHAEEYYMHLRRTVGTVNLATEVMVEKAATLQNKLHGCFDKIDEVVKIAGEIRKVERTAAGAAGSRGLESTVASRIMNR